MKKRNKIWTLVTPICHDILFRIAKQKKAPATKVILNIIYNKLPVDLEDDYTFVTDGSRKIVLMLNDKENEYISGLAANESLKPSKYIRMVIYTYLKHNGYID